MKRYKWSIDFAAKDKVHVKMIAGIVCLLAAVLVAVGCSIQSEDNKKVKDLDYTVVEDADLPEELKEIIEHKKSEEFKFTYGNEEYMYIVVGYGQQESGGYSIKLNDLYLSKNAIYIDTSLIGPQNNSSDNEDNNAVITPDNTLSSSASYPYIVVKLEYMNENVVFE